MDAADLTVECPNCKTQIRLTESLAAPLVAAVRREYEDRLRQQNADMAKREAAMRDREAALATAKENLDAQIAAKLAQERASIAAEEAKKARALLAADIEQREREKAELQEVLRARDQKLAEAQKKEAEWTRKERELEDARREIDLTIERRVNENLATIREQARRDAERTFGLTVMEKDQTIAAMQKKIEDLKQRAEQGSQQMQGEVQELHLEQLLREYFPKDAIEAVAQGEAGGDILQHVTDAAGRDCGMILWESKRTKNWSDAWLVKLRSDQRAARAEIAVLVTRVLPRGMDTFGLIDDVWVTPPATAMAVATVLRRAIIEVSIARQSAEGQSTKAEMVYQYLAGSRFKQRIQAIVEAFSSLREDLEKERKVIMKQWAKRAEQIDRVMAGTVGMYGDLQGIAGRSLQEIEGLELQALAGSAEIELPDQKEKGMQG